ncbi:metallophosphoesterase [Shewanella putrefaciens]|nr:metallophosphoesterase [Shewanella putrefaciens]
MTATYIFRFRDLGKKDGFTIEQHNSIVESQGDVWWGWWAKAGEKFPKHELEIAVEGSSVKIFLFDSGQFKFYQTNLTGVDATASSNRKVPAPENGSKTPDYYKTDELFGWLKISTITEVSCDQVLKAYSYIPLDDMYPSGSKDLDEQLFNKLVCSCLELKKQDRTIWKVRPKESGDSQHESLATHYTPYNYIKKHSQRESNFMVWLSDIHFDNGSGKHNFPFEDGMQHKCLSTRVSELIDHYASGSKCAGLAISGDITWQSQKEGFNHASIFIQDIISSQSLTPDDLIICPGNHDVGLVTREEYYENTRKPPSEHDWNVLATEYHEASKQNYVNFYKETFLREPESNLAQGRKFLLGGHKIVEVAAMNSCILQQVKNQFQGIGFIGEAQLDLAANGMGWVNSGLLIPKKNGVTRIVMLHHHLTPVNEVEDALLDARYSVTLDAERLMRWIVTHKVDYVLHGHMHRCNSITITRTLDPLKKISEQNPEHTFKIISLGSSGVSNSELPTTDNANYVCIIDFSCEAPIFNFHKLNKQSSPEKTPSYELVG